MTHRDWNKLKDAINKAMKSIFGTENVDWSKSKKMMKNIPVLQKDLSIVEWTKFAVIDTNLHELVVDDDDSTKICWCESLNHVLDAKAEFCADLEERIEALKGSKLHPFLAKLLLRRLHQDLDLLRGEATPPSPPSTTTTADGKINVSCIID